MPKIFYHNHDIFYHFPLSLSCIYVILSGFVFDDASRLYGSGLESTVTDFLTEFILTTFFKNGNLLQQKRNGIPFPGKEQR